MIHFYSYIYLEHLSEMDILKAIHYFIFLIFLLYFILLLLFLCMFSEFDIIENDHMIS